MGPLYSLLDKLRTQVRSIMERVAGKLNRLTGGRLHPAAITISGLLAHLPIAWLIATGSNGLLTGILLVFFGLFDTLDGELARLQKRASPGGMLLDASSDRMKEVVLYIGVAVAFINHADQYSLIAQYLAALAVAAAGGSLLVSYVKAKAETAIAGSGIPHNEVNHLFDDGLMRFEIRIAALAIGLMAGMTYLPLAVGFVAVGSWLTAVERLIKVSRKLQTQNLK